MPFKRKAQRRQFAELLVNGKISDQTYEEWNRSTGRKELPERVTPKAGSKTKKETTAKKTTPKKKTVKNRSETTKNKTRKR